MIVDSVEGVRTSMTGIGRASKWSHNNVTASALITCRHGPVAPMQWHAESQAAADVWRYWRRLVRDVQPLTVQPFTLPAAAGGITGAVTVPSVITGQVSTGALITNQGTGRLPLNQSRPVAPISPYGSLTHPLALLDGSASAWAGQGR
jgi:hypothetical protein